MLLRKETQTNIREDDQVINLLKKALGKKKIKIFFFSCLLSSLTSPSCIAKEVLEAPLNSLDEEILSLESKKNADVLFENLSTAAKLCKDAYKEEYVETQSSIIAYPFFNERDGKHAGHIYKNDKEITIVFRGTKDIPDWLGDFNALKVKNHPFGKGEVHQGFHNRFLDLEAGLITTLMALCGDDNPSDYQYKFYGHSLGGALATLCAAYLIQQGIPAEHMILISFGSPRVGDGDFAQDFNEKMEDRTLRIHFPDRDLVTSLPPKPDYQHVGRSLALKPPTELPICHMMTYYEQGMDNIFEEHQHPMVDPEEPAQRSRFGSFVAWGARKFARIGTATITTFSYYTGIGQRKES